MSVVGTTVTPRTSPAQRLSALARNQALQATFLLLVQVVLFLWTPISRYDDVYYSSADLTQAFALTRVEPGHQPGNQLQSDAVTQMQPWRIFNREELAAGRMPLWNPWNGGGRPHFANYQSAVLSPFILPFYVMGVKAALLLSAALKLFALGIFTWLFLRKIGVRHVAAVVGASVFMFAGHNSLLLYFPHVGAMAALPAALWCIEIALQRFERAQESGERASLRAPLAGLTIVLLAGLLAGNPEPLYFAILFIAMWSGARLAAVWIRMRDARARRQLLALAGKLVFAGVLAAGLASIQLLPFFEYLRESRVLQERSARQTPLEAKWWPLMLFPDALGNPGSVYKISENVPPPNYELVNMAYAGGTAILLALVSIVFARRDRRVLFFGLAAAVWLLYAYDLFGATDLFLKIPSLDRAPMNRSQGTWNFIVACSAALCVEHLWRSSGRRAWIGACTIVLLGIAGMVACMIGVDRLMAEFATFESPNHAHFLEYVPAHVRTMSALLVGAAVLAATLLIARNPVARTLSALGIAAACFLATGWLLHDYNPVAENRFYFPVTPAIRELKSIVGDERIAILGEDMIPPDSNIVYHLSLISNYDGMWVRDYDYLYRDHFGNGNNWRPITKGTKRSLKLFGVKYVLAKWGWNFIDDGLREFVKGGNQAPVRREILPDRDVTQTFRSREKDLQAVMVVLSTFPTQRPCMLHVKLEQIESGRVVLDTSMTSARVQSTVYSKRNFAWTGEYALNPTGRPVVFRFEPQSDSYLKHYKLTLSCAEGLGGDTICAWSMPLNGYGEGDAMHGKKKLPGEILFDWSYDGPETFEPVAQLEEMTLYRFKDAIPEFTLVRDPIIVADHAAALYCMRTSAFDLLRNVVLEDPDATPRAARRVVRFKGSDWCYLVAPDGRTLAHIDDETTFLANELRWNQIEELPESDKASYTILPDSDRAARLATGLVIIDKDAPVTDKVEVLDRTPLHAHLHVSRPRSTWLVWDQAYFPGWKARLNGVETPIRRANFAFSAFEVPAGDWQIDLDYEPESLRQGEWIGMASLFLGLGSLFLGRRKRSA